MSEKRYGYVDASIHGLKNAKLTLEVEEGELRATSESIEVMVKGEIDKEMIYLWEKHQAVNSVIPGLPIPENKWDGARVSIEIDSYMGAEARLRKAASVIAGAIFSTIDTDSPRGSG